MISHFQIEQVAISEYEYGVCQDHAKAANLGGKSHVDKKRRHQGDYQLVGQLCEAATYIYFTRRFDLYDQRRQKINKTPNKGDGGHDLIDSNGRKVDAKGSLVRTRKYLEDHNLYIRQDERKADRYVLALVHPDDMRVVNLVGWWPDYLLNSTPSMKDGDRYDVPAKLLYPMHLYWEFR